MIKDVRDTNDYAMLAEVLLADVIQKLVNQPQTKEQAEIMKAALGIVIYQLSIKFQLRILPNEDRYTKT